MLRRPLDSCDGVRVDAAQIIDQEYALDFRFLTNCQTVFVASPAGILKESVAPPACTEVAQRARIASGLTRIPVRQNVTRVASLVGIPFSRSMSESVMRRDGIKLRLRIFLCR